MSWEDYVSYLKGGNVCDEAIIFDNKGVVHASSVGIASGATLPTYHIPVEDPEDPTKTQDFEYNEQAELLKALANNGVAEHAAGLRVNNTKYMTVSFDHEAGTWYLKRAGGGAALFFTPNVIVFGSFSNDSKTEAGTPQNASDTNRRVEALGALLKSHGL